MLKFSKTEYKNRISEQAQIAFDAAIKEAQRCLENADFIKYKNAYKVVEKKLIEELVYIDENEFDVNRYAFRVKDVLSKLKHIGALLRAVSKEAGK